MPPRSGTGKTAWSQFKEALRSNDNFEYMYWMQIGIFCIFDWFIRILGPVLVVFAVGLIGVIAYMFMVFILPAAISNVAFRIPNIIWCVFCVTNIYFNYLSCVFTKPGTTGDASEYEDKLIPRRLELFHDVQEETEPVLQREGRGNGTITGRAVQQQQKLGVEQRWSALRHCQAGFCKKCQDIKPVRAHHCHICDCCILNMDHHCPWVNNCVGYNNIRYFLLFLVYVWAGCFYAALVTLPQFLQSCKGRTVAASFLFRVHLDASQQTAITLCFILTTSVGLAISILLGWNLYLVCTAQVRFTINSGLIAQILVMGPFVNSFSFQTITTIEFYENRTRQINARHRGEVFSNPFNLGWRKNWAQVFGDGPILLTLITSPSLRKPPPPIVSFFEGAAQIPNQDLIDLPQDPEFLV